MNILFTSSGRRNYLIEYFKEALKPFNGKVHSMNSYIFASALWVSDYKVISPLIYSGQYESFLLNYCLENEITIVISLFDIDLPILSSLKKKFQDYNINIIVGDEWLTSMANDKWLTHKFLIENGFQYKPCFLSLNDFKSDLNNLTFDNPVFIKPRWGMGSLSVFKADSIEEVEFFYNLAKKQIQKSYLKFESKADWENSVLIQSQLPGEEYGLDVINDLNGNYCTTIVKKKLAMRSGETDVAEIVEIPQLVDLGRKLSLLTKHPANLDVDVFYDGKNAYILEINPRFGGGYPFSHESGVNLPLAIIKWQLGQEIEKEILKAKVGTICMKGIKLIKTY
ncbi:MAG: ATP-grasp domain-containing protein [Bacteroidia bacterium]